MLKELKFVQGAVAKKDFIPAMTHFVIEGGHVRGFNGTLALSSPIPFDLDCKPKAAPLVRAIANCTETVTLGLTASGKLRIQSGKFKAYIDTVDGETPHVTPEGNEVAIDGEAMLQAFKVLLPLTGNDASRPWTNGVLLRGSSAFATNNVILTEYWVREQFPMEVNIPAAAVKELVRIGEPPTHAQVSNHNITFHYDDGRWIYSALLSPKWPDMGKVLNKESKPKPLHPQLFEALAAIKPFSDQMGRVFMMGDRVATHTGDNEGAGYDLPGLDCDGCYRIEMLQLLDGIANMADLSHWPEPGLFFGDNLRGAIIGLRL